MMMEIIIVIIGTSANLLSSGYAYDGDCIYVNGSGRGTYDFFIQLNRCGTLSGNEKGREDLRGRTPSVGGWRGRRRKGNEVVRVYMA